MTNRRQFLASLCTVPWWPASAAAADGDLARRLVVPAPAADVAPLFTGELEGTLPHRVVSAGPLASPLPEGESLPPGWRYSHAGVELAVGDYLLRQPVTGLLVAKDARIVFEAYAKPYSRDTRFLSASMAKSLVGLLVGLALEDGSIASLDDEAARYVPALRASAYGETPIRHLLAMSSGVRFAERYDDADDLRRLLLDTIERKSPGGADVLLPYRERRARPGAMFAYSSADTQALALVVRAAVGAPLADYLAARVWQPMGAEAHGSFLVDAAGVEAAYAFFHARLRDFARLGVALADAGGIGQRQVIPAPWLERAGAVAGPHTQPYVASAFFGYGYHFWTFPGARRQFAMRGVRGQVVFVDPAARLVLAQTALWPSAGDRAAQAELVSVWQGLVGYFTGEHARPRPS